MIGHANLHSISELERNGSVVALEKSGRQSEMDRSTVWGVTPEVHIISYQTNQTM